MRAFQAQRFAKSPCSESCSTRMWSCKGFRRVTRSDPFCNADTFKLPRRLKDCVQDDGKLYLVFEFVDKDLKKYMESTGAPLDPELVKVTAVLARAEATAFE
eukprot:scaffold1638_cov258-Pinguiococcus_pyrenoidosus.AAC.16